MEKVALVEIGKQDMVILPLYVEGYEIVVFQDDKLIQKRTIKQYSLDTEKNLLITVNNDGKPNIFLVTGSQRMRITEFEKFFPDYWEQI